MHPLLVTNRSVGVIRFQHPQYFLTLPYVEVSLRLYGWMDYND